MEEKQLEQENIQLNEKIDELLSEQYTLECLLKQAREVMVDYFDKKNIKQLEQIRWANMKKFAMFLCAYDLHKEIVNERLH